MNSLDKNYLLLQFQNKVYLKNGTEFQSFFESVMEKAFSDFKKIRPYGNMGDGGNDGYRKHEGIYYQVNAPINPKEKEAEAARKLKNDFQKLKTNWEGISSIKKYIFVLNDKYGGSVQLLEQAITVLNEDNPKIDFELFLAKDLEHLFFQLNTSDIRSLGFDVDSTKSIKFAYKNLDNVKNELSGENVEFAVKLLENCKDIIFSLNDEGLSLEYEILECRCLQKLEKVAEAKEKYENISKRFPNDSRALLYLAEIYLNNKDYDKNKELLKQAEEIDENYWLLKLEQLVRDNHLSKKIDKKNIDEKTFPNDQVIKSNFYRLYAPFYEASKDQKNADSFIEKAIHSNPNGLVNYIAKLSLIESRLFSCQDASQQLQRSQELLEEITNVESTLFEYENITARNKAILNVIKLHVLRIQENFPEFEKISKETFEFATSCYFDKQIEQIIVGILQLVSLPDDDLNKLLVYLKNAERAISDELSKVLIFQFNIRDTLFTDGEKFFNETSNQVYCDFISNLKNKHHQKVLKFLEEDIQFAVTIAHTLRNTPDLREKIINKLPDDIHIQKEKLLLLLSFDEKDFDKAFNILKQLDLSNLNYLECKPILQIIQHKKAWDFEIIVLNKLLEKEKNKEEVFSLKLQLLNANIGLNKYAEVINLGTQLLKEDSTESILEPRNREILLTNTILACFERGKIFEDDLSKSKEILEKYQLANPSFEFKVGIEAEVYLKNSEVEQALNSIIEGVKIKRILSPKEYAKLYFLLSIELGNKIDINLNSLEISSDNTFVKLKNKDQWYFIGSDNELDAIPISNSNNKYHLFIEKKLGDKIVFENKYSSKNHEDIIEIIFPIEKYVLWKASQNFNTLSRDGDIEGVQLVDIPLKEDTINTDSLLQLLEDLQKRTTPFFKMYCENDFPLAALAVSEGGLTNAIARIQQENKGFIHFSNGTTKEFEKQKEIAKNIIDKKQPFYIDGSSALVLSETGLLQKIHAHIPNLKVPQSVITLLTDTAGKFEYTAGQVGYMGYAQGKIKFSSVENNKRKLIKSNFTESIHLLELNPENISVVSSVNKIDCFSEQEVPDELSDACIYAQKENLPILTEDFLYLKMNEFQTKKSMPKYFSSLALLKVIYENGQISFEEYINYFSYLSSYRFRFLSLNSEDIGKAVFGDQKIKTINPENIRKLNFPLTMSEEYGVTFQAAFTVIGKFFLKILIDNSVTIDVAEKIFIEIIEAFPTKMNKKDFGQMLLRVCTEAIENNKSEFIMYPKTQLTHQKIDKLFNTTEIFDSIPIIL